MSVTASQAAGWEGKQWVIDWQCLPRMRCSKGPPLGYLPCLIWIQPLILQVIKLKFRELGCPHQDHTPSEKQNWTSDPALYLSTWVLFLTSTHLLLFVGLERADLVSEPGKIRELAGSNT